jgi:hypothetical protein
MDIYLLVLGFVGGAVRALTGFIKYQFSYREVPFRILYFLALILISGGIGLIVSAFFNEGPLFSFVVGYAGGDFLENIYKIFAQKDSLFPNNKS